MDYLTLQHLQQDDAESLYDSNFYLLTAETQIKQILEHANIECCKAFCQNCTEDEFTFDGSAYINLSLLIKYRRFDLFQDLEDLDLINYDFIDDGLPLALCIENQSYEFFNYYLEKAVKLDQILGFEVSSVIDLADVKKLTEIAHCPLAQALNLEKNTYYLDKLTEKGSQLALKDTRKTLSFFKKLVKSLLLVKTSEPATA